MTFDEVLAQVQELLEREKRVSYRGLKRQFALDEEYLEDLKEELIGAKRLAVDEDGRFLVWTGGTTVPSDPLPVTSPSLSIPSPQPLDVRPQTLDSRRDAGERRQLTVEFIDLVGSTTLSQQLDPEDYHARVVAYQTACQRVIARYDGYIAQYLGDGVLVYFGYPMAHEEDAVRAVRSGLEIVTAVSQLAYMPPLQVRIGIHTGPVVIGEIGAGERTERLALGETPNIAARVQGIAEPNTVIISEATHRLVQGLFECQNRGPQVLKGVSAPVPVYRVLRESEAQSRFDVAFRTGVTPLVGREEELGLLRRRWEQAKAGAGQVVLLGGEPGIGKSRLVQMLKEHASAEGATLIEFRCSPYHQNSAFYPIIEHLQRLLQFAPQDKPQTKLGKLQQALAAYRFPRADTLPLLAALLSLPHPVDAPPLTLSPQKQKQKTQEALAAWLREEAECQAVFNAWEDLHWADPSTLELLSLYLDQIPTARVLALLVFRPEFILPWQTRSYFSQLALNRLGHQEVIHMVGQVTGGRALPSEIMEQVVAKTDGIPLFVEELTKMVVESGILRAVNNHYELTQPLSTLTIPSTLQDSLMARLDRLGMAKEVAQLGATIGREFSYELLQAVSSLDETRLQQGLRQLVVAELVYQHGLPPQAHYLFKHALIRDTAYHSLLKRTRQQYHQQIAEVLVVCFSETVETQPELVAQHYTEAGLSAQALPYWQQAGQRAVQRSANAEAINHLTKGLDVLKTLPDTPERIQQELTLQIVLGAPLMATKGYGAPEVEQAYARALELCRQIGETLQIFPVLRGLQAFYIVREKYKTGRELGEQLLSLAQSVQDPAFLLMAHNALGGTFFHLGEFTSAREHLEQSIALYDPQQHNPQAAHTPHDLGVVCRSYTAWTLWSLGYSEQALKRSHEALTLARELAHPVSLVYALHAGALLHQFRRERQTVQERAEAVIALSEQQGLPYFLAIGTIWHGWALAEQGQEEEGIVQIHQGLAAMRATGTGHGLTYFLALLAEAYEKTRQTEKGLSALAEALALVSKNGDRIYEAELYRLKGELTLQSESPGIESRTREAEACFHKAIEIARHQQAKSLELRAVISLARLWQQQGKNDEARQLLAEIYGWFTEGFDTKDLQEAKALLDDLAA